MYSETMKISPRTSYVLLLLLLVPLASSAAATKLSVHYQDGKYSVTEGR